MAQSPRKKLASKERNKFNLGNWNLAFDVVFAMILKLEPEWSPSTVLTDARRTSIAHLVNAGYRKNGSDLVDHDAWQRMVGSALSGKMDPKIVNRYRSLTGKS